MSELVDKQAVLRAISELSFVGYLNADDIHDAVEWLPVVEERKKGKWIRNSNGTYSCCLCHSWIPEEQSHYANFCLYCGADMREEKSKKGKWICGYDVRCPNCNYKLQTTGLPSRCPNCYAEMEITQ